MCGICGFVGHNHITMEQLRAMNDSMIYRGPDDRGTEIFPGGSGDLIGMAQRRLSILDLSPLGHQPMHSPDGRITVVYNGEIYNYQDLYKELPDYHFISTCDTEVIIAAYLKWGISCVHRFNGMFAIALYDRDIDTTFLIRDRMGVKPLYYWLDGEKEAPLVESSLLTPAPSAGELSWRQITQEGGTGLVYASELKPIMLCPGFYKEIRTDVLARYLFQQYINAPETVFRHVYKLEPGSILRYHNGAVDIAKFWDTASVYHQMAADPVTDYAQAKAELKDLIRSAVARRMIADVPLGCFLSGGYDSSLVSAAAQEYLGSTPLKTFSIGFSEKEYNEAEYAAGVAKFLGTDHTQMIIGEKEMFDLVESIPKYFDEPMADSSEIPTMLVSMLARQKVTVALSGDAGDEFFCGYNNYDDVALAQRLDRAGAAAHAIGKLGLSRLYPMKVRVIASNRNPETKTQFFGAGGYIEAAQKMVMAKDQLPVSYPIESRYGVSGWQIRRMLLDMDTYLPGDILTKVDRASMKYSLESRCPLLDKEVMEYSYRIPHAFKYRDGVKKYILKDIARDYIPANLLDRPKKGFGVPLDKWMRGPLREQLEAFAQEEYLKQQGIFDPVFTSQLIRDYLTNGDGGPATGKNYSKIAWSFFVFQQWYRQYMQN